MVKSYPKPVEDALIAFLVSFIHSTIEALEDSILFFLVLDNVSLMDASSWALLEAI
jgi:hypothetical protein